MSVSRGIIWWQLSVVVWGSVSSVIQGKNIKDWQSQLDDPSGADNQIEDKEF